MLLASFKIDHISHGVFQVSVIECPRQSDQSLPHIRCRELNDLCTSATLWLWQKQYHQPTGMFWRLLPPGRNGNDHSLHLGHFSSGPLRSTLYFSLFGCDGLCKSLVFELFDSSFPIKPKTWILLTSHNFRVQTSASQPYWIPPTWLYLKRSEMWAQPGLEKDWVLLRGLEA